MWQHPFRVTRTGTKAKGPARGDREPGTEDTVDGPDVLFYIFPHPMLSGRCLVDMADPSVRPIRHGEWCQNFQRPEYQTDSQSPPSFIWLVKDVFQIAST